MKSYFLKKETYFEVSAKRSEYSKVSATSDTPRRTKAHDGCVLELNSELSAHSSKRSELERVTKLYCCFYNTREVCFYGTNCRHSM